MDVLLAAHAKSAGVCASRIARAATLAYAQAIEYANSPDVVDYVTSLHAVPCHPGTLCPEAAPGEFKDGELVIVRMPEGTPTLEEALEQWRVCKEYMRAEGAADLFKTDGFLMHFMSVPMTEEELLRLFKVIVLSAGIQETVVYDSTDPAHNTVESYVQAMQGVADKLKLSEGHTIAQSMDCLYSVRPEDEWKDVPASGGLEATPRGFAKGHSFHRVAKQDRLRHYMLSLYARNVGELVGVSPKSVFDNVKSTPQRKKLWGDVSVFVLNPFLASTTPGPETPVCTNSNNAARAFKSAEKLAGVILQRKIVQLGNLIVTVSVIRGVDVGSRPGSIVCVFNIFKHPKQLVLQQMGLLTEPKLAARLQLFNILSAAAQIVCSSPLDSMVPVFEALEDKGVLVPSSEATADSRNAILKLQNSDRRNHICRTVLFSSHQFWVIAPETIDDPPGNGTGRSWYPDGKLGHF